MICPEKWCPAGGLTLEPNAMLAATERSRCLALTAGPGAGKTEMLAQRADFLLQTGFCRYPKRILAISFKVDASKNLKERVSRRCGVSLGTRFDSHTFHAFAKRLIDRFRPILTGADALDADYQIGDKRVTRKQITFLDLVPFALTILRNSPVARNAVRQTYSDVFLDEFQDCTTSQYELIRFAFKDTGIRLTAVGDTKQRIMGWAGALEGIFSTFAADFNALGLNLYRNFRSQPNLIRLQNEVVKTLDVTAAAADKDIVGDGGIISLLAFQNPGQEAKHLANEIQSWIDTGEVPFSEIAILVSKQPEQYAEAILVELEARGFPYRNEQRMQDLCVEPVTLLVMDFLLVLYGKREPDAYLRLMNTFSSVAYDEDEQAEVRANWNNYIQKIGVDARAQPANYSNVKKVVLDFLRKFGRDALTALSADYEQGNRLNEIVRELLEQISERLSIDSDVLKVVSCFSDSNAIRVMTIHKSKGLEFDSVILLGVESETFWGNVDDERCVFFVGISRAKRVLILTRTEERPMPAIRPRRWDVQRKPHEEFTGYVKKFTDEIFVR